MRRAGLVAIGALVILAIGGLQGAASGQDYSDSQATTPTQEPPAVVGLLCRQTMDDDTRELRSRPRDCNTLGYQDSFAEAVNLKELTWSSWGGPEARARGIIRSWRNYGRLRYRTFVKAYRLRPFCGGPDSLYTRIRLSKNGRSFNNPPVVIPDCE